MTKFECLECAHVWEVKPKTGAENFVNFILCVFSIYLLFAFFPLAILLWVFIWLFNRVKCPRCRSKRFANLNVKS